MKTETTTIQSAFKTLKQNRRLLTRQQYNTIKGQLIAGDITGALKGLKKIKTERKNHDI